MRTDSLGNQKWWRGYNTLTQDTTVENYIYDLQLMSNGDIVTVGWVGSNVNLPAQQTWVLKVDSNGCLGAGNCPPTGLSMKTGLPALNTSSACFKCNRPSFVSSNTQSTFANNSAIDSTTSTPSVLISVVYCGILLALDWISALPNGYAATTRKPASCSLGDG